MNPDDPQELERYLAVRWYWLRLTVEESGLNDFIPDRTEMGDDGPWTWCLLESRSRGPVTNRISTDLLMQWAMGLEESALAVYREHDRGVKAEVLFPVARDYAAMLEAKRAAPNRKRTATSEAKASRAREIISEGKGWAYVVDRAIAEGLIKIKPTGRDGHPREPEEIHDLAVRSLKRLISEK